MMIQIVLLEHSKIDLSVKCYINTFYLHSYLLKIYAFCIFLIIFNITWYFLELTANSTHGNKQTPVEN